MSEVILPKPPDFPITNQDQARALVPDLQEYVSMRLRSLKVEINCAQVGTVQSFNPGNQTVDVALNVMRAFEGQIKKYPILISVPAVVLSGGPGAITFPITAGDQCLVLFCDRDIDAWVTAGSTTVPATERAHDLSDGIALIGIRPLSSPLSGYESNGVHVYHGTAKEAKLSLEEGVKAQLEHKKSRVTLVDTTEASLNRDYNKVKITTKIRDQVEIARLTAGALVVGKRYVIINYKTGDDFSSVGAASNSTGSEFVATGTTPTWGAGSTVIQIATLKDAMDSLFTALTGWINTDYSTPNGATLALLNLAKLIFEEVLT